MRRLSIAQLQTDENQTIVGGKERPIWVFVILDGWFSTLASLVKIVAVSEDPLHDIRQGVRLM
jgi:hypothetical protein